VALRRDLEPCQSLELEWEVFVLVKQVFACPSEVEKPILVPNDRFLRRCGDCDLVFVLGGYNLSYPSAGRGLLDVNCIPYLTRIMRPTRRSCESVFLTPPYLASKDCFFAGFGSLGRAIVFGGVALGEGGKDNGEPASDDYAAHVCMCEWVCESAWMAKAKSCLMCRV
jgi:hypothetical protein